MKLRHARTFAAIAAAALLSAPALAADKVKVGFISTLSGPASALGVDMRDAFQLFLKMSNNKLGGLPAELIVVDDQLNPDTGKQLADRLIKRERVDFITGLVFTNVLLAIQPQALEAKTIIISSNPGPSQLAGEQCNKYFFANSYNNDVNIGTAPGMVAQSKGFKNVVAIAPNYPAGRDAITGLKSSYKGKIAEEIFIKLGQLDYAAELAQIRSLKPDAVVYFLPGGMGVNFIKQFVGSGLSKDTTLITGSSGADEDIIPAVGTPMLGLLNTSTWGHDLPYPENQKFVAAFEETYKRIPSVYAAHAYDTAMMMDAAVRDVKGKVEDREALIKAIRAKRYKSVRGDFRWQNNNFPSQEWYLRVVANDSKGRITNKIIGTLAKDMGDAHTGKCPMKW